MGKVKTFIEWTEDLSVGVQEIDEQHKVLVGLLNKLYEAIILRQDNSKTIHSIVNELNQYTIIHFAVEESLMRIFDYPLYEEHKRHHQELTKQVADLRSKLQNNETAISMDLLNFLRHWLTEHIMGDDKKYGPFLLERGLNKNWKRSWVGKIWDTIH